MCDPHVYDTALLGILQREGQIAEFLDVVMGFLYRRTDFFHVMRSKDESLGFPPGVAPRLLITAYEKYEVMSKKRDLTKERRTIIPASKGTSVKPATPAQTTNQSPAADSEVLPEPTDIDGPSAITNVPDPGTTVPDMAVEEEVKLTEKSESQMAKLQASSISSNQKTFQENPESYNGAVREKYRWAQSITDCDLRVNVPKGVVKAKQVSVSIKRKRIRVATPAHATSDALIDLPLSWDVRPDESVWSLIPGDCVHLNLEKVQERWWDSVFEGEPKINVREIDAAVEMSDMDDGAQSTVAKLMYDEKQKQLGLPTSDQQKTNDILRKAWDADGSPFKGTPFDPSRVTMN